MTSFVPKDELELIVDGAKKASVYEEDVVSGVANEEVGQGEQAEYEKTITTHDRSEPAFGKVPLFSMPDIWSTKLEKTGITMLGIEHSEIPLVTFDITIDGGHWLDPFDKSGVSSLLASLMMQGTRNRTAAELEEAIELLGASMDINSGAEEIRITASCLADNFEATVALVEEILLEPRWDESEFMRLKQALKTKLKGNEANPTSIAFSNFSKLIYGDSHIMGVPSTGSMETIQNINIEDLKAFYRDNLSASVANIHVVGFVDQEQVIKAFAGIDQRWETKQVAKPIYELPENSLAGNLYFIDVPNSKQSTLILGRLTLSASDVNYNNLDFANEILGGGSAGRLMQILRIEKGYTYGAYSFLREYREVSPFIAYTRVRANATKQSMDIIYDLLDNYGSSFSEEDVAITKNKILKGNTRAFESMAAKLAILRNMSKYDKSTKYLEEDQDELMNLTLDDFTSIINNYITKDKMVYLIVGDKASQWDEINQLAKGQAIELDIFGNSVSHN